MRKTVFSVCNQVKLQPASSASETVEYWNLACIKLSYYTLSKSSQDYSWIQDFEADFLFKILNSTDYNSFSDLFLFVLKTIIDHFKNEIAIIL